MAIILATSVKYTGIFSTYQNMTSDLSCVSFVNETSNVIHVKFLQGKQVCQYQQKDMRFEEWYFMAFSWRWRKLHLWWKLLWKDTCWWESNALIQRYSENFILAHIINRTYMYTVSSRNVSLQQTFQENCRVSQAWQSAHSPEASFSTDLQNWASCFKKEK